MKTFDFTVSMKVVNITASEIMNITYSNAFCAAVAQSMETKTSYVAFQSYSQLKRRLLSAATILDLVFSISLPIYWYSNSSVPFNASEVKPRLISNYIASVDAGDTLRYVLQELLKSGISASFLILPIRIPTESRSPSPSPSNTPLYIFVAAVVGGALLVLVCIGWIFIIVRRRSKKSSYEKKYKPMYTPLVDEEMSMGSIYSSSPRSSGENGYFSNTSKFARGGEEHKEGTFIISKPEMMFDLATMQEVHYNDVQHSSSTSFSPVMSEKHRRFDASSFSSPVPNHTVGINDLDNDHDTSQGIVQSATFAKGSSNTNMSAKTSATRFAHPSLPLSNLAAAKKRFLRVVELPRKEEVPIVEVFKSADVMHASMLSPRMRFRLSKLKFQLNSTEENW